MVKASATTKKPTPKTKKQNRLSSHVPSLTKLQRKLFTVTREETKENVGFRNKGFRTGEMQMLCSEASLHSYHDADIGYGSKSDYDIAIEEDGRRT